MFIGDPKFEKIHSKSIVCLCTAAPFTKPGDTVCWLGVMVSQAVKDALAKAKARSTKTRARLGTLITPRRVTYSKLD